MQLTSLVPAQRTLAEDVINQCIMSRLYFVEHVLGVERLEDWQRAELQALDDGELKLSIRSGHGVGKTAFCSWLATHFVLFRDDVKVIVTAPALSQLRDGLIPEVHKWVDKLPVWMRNNLNLTSERITRGPNHAKNFISFRTARAEKPDALQGIHATNVLLIVDEAAGLDESVYEAGEGSLSTKGAIAVLIGNPTSTSGYFYNTHHSTSHLWRTRRVSCLESTRADASFIENIKATYGVDSRQYRVRVLGEFPDASVGQVIPRSYAESCIDRDTATLRENRFWGVDVGRGGDPSGFIDRSDNAILAAKLLKYEDVMQVANWVHRRYELTSKKFRPKKIFVDRIGIGAGVADRLTELNLPVVGVNVSELGPKKDLFPRLRPELWYEVRAWLEPKNVTFAECEDIDEVKLLVEELCSIREKMTPGGKMDVESKDAMRKRGVRSPNLADALCLTFAEGASVLGGASDLSAWSSVDLSDYRAPNIV